MSLHGIYINAKTLGRYQQALALFEIIVLYHHDEKCDKDMASP